MDKKRILNAVLKELEKDLRSQLTAQEQAAAGATHAEARAETKWDTCGLEQSYLARGLAKQFEIQAKQFNVLRAFTPPDFKGKPIGNGALIQAEMDGERNLFFMLEGGGGTEIELKEKTVLVITPDSPVGSAMLGKDAGDTYSFRAGINGRIIDVE